MFHWIIGSSLQFRYIVIGLAAALAAYGWVGLQRMPVDVLPEFAPPIVEVQTEAIGLPAKDVESLITLNLEELLSGIPWLESIRSRSVTGLSSVLMTFQSGTDIIKARQMVQERLTLAYTLPNVSTPPVIIQPRSATSRFMMIGVSSKSVETTELSLLARWTIKPKLLGVPGVANVAIWGQKLRQLQVHIDPERLREARVTQDDIIAAAGDALWVSPLSFLRGSAPGTGGWIDNANQRLGVHHQMPIQQPEDMAKVPIGAPHLLMTGRSMALGDVAEVTFSHPPLIGDAIVNRGNGLLIVVEKFPSANTLEVTRGVEQALAELSRGLPGVDIDPTVFRLASYIDDSLGNVKGAILAGALLVVLALGAFLFDWRAALVSAVSIPLSLIAALAALYLTGTTLNTMILAGLVLALGVVIDDAVVDVERLMRRLRSRGEATVASVIYEATFQTRTVALYGTLIVLLGVAPIFFMGGVAGRFFTPLAAAYLLAAVASMLVALSVTPALALLVLGRNPRPMRESPLTAWLRTRYEAALRRIVAAPAATFVAAPRCWWSAWPWRRSSASLPARVQGARPRSECHHRAGHFVQRSLPRDFPARRELRALPGVRNVGAHIGRAITGDQIVGINSSQLWVSIDAKADYDRTLAAIRETIDGYPGVQASVQNYLRDKVGEVLTGTANALVVRIYGPHPDTLREKAEEVRRALAGVRGIVDLRTEGQVEEPQVKVKVNLDAAGRANIKPGDVRRASATVFSGITVGFLFEDQRIYDVVVWGAPEARDSLTKLKDLWVERGDRKAVRLGEVADVRIVPTPTMIRHEGISPYVDVVANVSGRALGSVVDEVEDELEKIAFPLEHNPKILGEYGARLEAQERVLAIALAAMVGIFLLLQARFGSWRLAFIAFLALPASVVGGLLAASVSGAMISLGSIVGLLAVLGIASRHGLLLIDRYRRLEREQGVPFGPELVVRGARERLAPMAASSAAVLGALRRSCCSLRGRAWRSCSRWRSSSPAA